MRHILKTWPTYFDAVASGAKTFEVRRDDRGFQKGDEVELQFYDPRGSVRDPKPLHFRIGWILTGGQFGIQPGYVVFSLESPTPSSDAGGGEG